MNKDTGTPAKQARSGQPDRDGKGRFVKGMSGNPWGRHPRGLATVEKLRSALADELPVILESVVKRARDGDLAACRLILERVLPPIKAMECPVTLGELSGTRTEQGQAILNEVAAGRLGPGQAAQLFVALVSQSKIVEIDELERRLAGIEKKFDENYE